MEEIDWMSVKLETKPITNRPLIQRKRWLKGQQTQFNQSIIPSIHTAAGTARKQSIIHFIHN